MSYRFWCDNEVDKIIKLSKNERSNRKHSNQKRFRPMLLNIRNGDCDEVEWNLLLTRTLDLNKNIINTGEYKR